ncbi:MAG: YraN family protein [Acutalibacteraceae bacterium]
MLKTCKKEVGQFGERCAAKYLQNKGYTVADRNYRTKYGEVDIIAEDEKYIAFTEVKTRSINSSERPILAVNREKQRKLITTAFFFLREHKIIKQPRFDVVEVLYDMQNKNHVFVRHIPNAFIQEGDYAPF